MTGSILIVEGDATLARVLTAALCAVALDIDVVASGAAALAHLATATPACVVLDHELADMDGLDLLTTLRAHHPGMPVIFTARGGEDAVAVDALQRGATDYLLRHDDWREHLATVIRKALGHEVREQHEGDPDGLVCRSPSMQAVARLVATAAQQCGHLLIEGETGTGKEFIAGLIHRRSARGGGPLIFQNWACAAEQIIAAELTGVFRAAEGGTLFLENVCEHPRLQAKLLNLLAESESRRDDRPRPLDVRLIVGSGGAAVQPGAMSPELYARLPLRIRLPPLRERREDIVPLAVQFLGRYRHAHAMTPLQFHPTTLQALERYDWPGNVRELEHVVARVAILAAPGQPIGCELLPDCVSTSVPRGDLPPAESLHVPSLIDLVSEFERSIASRPPPERVTFDGTSGEGVVCGTGLTARCGSETTFAMVRATRSHAAGRWYVELTLRLAHGAKEPGAWTDAGIVARGARRVRGYGARRTLGEQMADGDEIGLAIDLDLGRLYVRRNGTWVDGEPGDPDGGIRIRCGRAYVVAVSITRPVAQVGESDAWTANFGAAPFAGSLPVGYRSYDPTYYGSRG